MSAKESRLRADAALGWTIAGAYAYDARGGWGIASVFLLIVAFALLWPLLPVPSPEPTREEPSK